MHRTSRPPSLPSWTVNRPYPSTTLTATGGTPPYWWTATGLPAGLSIDGATGVISGTPTATRHGERATITVTDILGQTDTPDFSITINPAADDHARRRPTGPSTFDYEQLPDAGDRRHHTVHVDGERTCRPA